MDMVWTPNLTIKAKYEVPRIGEYFTKKRHFCQEGPHQQCHFFANQIFGEILTKTSILMQNCIDAEMIRRNLQNIIYR